MDAIENKKEFIKINNVKTFVLSAALGAVCCNNQIFSMFSEHDQGKNQEEKKNENEIDTTKKTKEEGKTHMGDFIEKLSEFKMCPCFEGWLDNIIKEEGGGTPGADANPEFETPLKEDK